MAISRVAYTEGTSNLGGTPSIVIPTGTADGDLILIFSSGWNATQLAGLTGYQRLGSAASDGVYTNIDFAYASSAVDFSATSVGGGRINWLVVTYTGVEAISGAVIPNSHNPPN